MASTIPQILIKEFLKNPRLTAGPPNGTRPIDLKIFQQAIRETLANREVLQSVVNSAMKQVEFRVK
jgi:hypothetical protein